MRVLKKKVIGLFSFDGPMYKDKNGIYCNMYITDEMLERYLLVVDELLILIRTFDLNNTYKEENMKPILSQNVKIIEVPNLNSPKGMIFEKSKWKKSIRELVNISDLIFCRIPSVLSDLVAKEAKKMNYPYLVEVGGDSWDAYWNHSFYGKIVAPLMYYNQKKSVEGADFASYVTKKWLQERYPSNKKANQLVASNVIISEVNEKNIFKKIEKYKLLTRDSPIIIGTIANVDVKYKGQEYVIRAIAPLIRKGYKISYELVGGGDITRLLKLAKKLNIENNIIFKGRMLHEEIFKWLDSVDIYAQPSKQEGLPRSVIEAMSRGCICIGSTTAGIPELLQTNLIFKNGDVDKISRIIEMILVQESDRNCEISIENIAESKQYLSNVLKQRRNKFYSDYRDEVISFLSKQEMM
ncbi:GDP-mannose-dependent alpha-(1-6)-phosphatidylinositol monomannoside mannosyltransferase [Streptococcus parauberis]|nr:GDP-mannose-dependent alpha-(1-6)-phosphatidylinositol monomannoside mannosyltransferase [Streptococcus parauberis]KYP21235.1 GDP-mannose-dependent alpha-(1-6)-phosphatidylinositol monomannoside mannosyltransferase [Streptococcus parauberis]KYP22369.1 GDP-mannose-dependent alpha-(1-6)-phosphatidylinositol monomannoside mannosyltransferase [Streptococcus parauberis]KYP24894.1 GDP-mannose-dependent alpha-(1-6)-phosphatidylinositol monomannoside mannosyltransferase [Streptococcus parauberis]KYP